MKTNWVKRIFESNCLTVMFLFDIFVPVGSSDRATLFYIDAITKPPKIHKNTASNPHQQIKTIILKQDFLGLVKTLGCGFTFASGFVFFHL